MSVRCKRTAAVIFLCALLVRGLIVPLIAVDVPSADGLVYDAIAVNLWEGRGFGWLSDDIVYRADRPPAYPFFLLFHYCLFGYSLTAVQVTQVLLSALTCVLVFAIGLRAGGYGTGALGASLCCIYQWLAAGFTGSLYSETLAIFLLCLLVSTIPSVGLIRS